MSAPRWTPGPWATSGMRTKCLSFGGHLSPALSVFDVGRNLSVAFIPYSDRTPKDHVQSHADQKLIAAAPDLYAALEALLESADRTNLHAARAALRRARGEP